MISLLGQGKLNDTKTTLLYSAKSEDELIFKDRLDKEICVNGISQRYFITGPEPTTSNNELTTCGRMTKDDLAAAANELSGTRTFAYVCGPPEMIKAVTADLESLNIKTEDIFYEMWW